MTEHDAKGLEIIAGWLERDGLIEPATMLRRLAAGASEGQADLDVVAQKSMTPAEMKFLTREQVIALYFKSSGRFGPADDIVDFAGELEELIVKSYSKEIIDTAKWAMKPDTI